MIIQLAFYGEKTDLSDSTKEAPGMSIIGRVWGDPEGGINNNSTKGVVSFLDHARPHTVNVIRNTKGLTLPGKIV